MKTLILLIVLLIMHACKNDSLIPQAEEPINTTTIHDVTEQTRLPSKTIDSITISEKNKELDPNKTPSIVIKRDRLLTAKDDKIKLQESIITKSFFKEEDLYILDYKYPYLNEKNDQNLYVFNKFIKDTYLDIEAVENEILEDKALYCDSLGMWRCMDKRIIDYKVYASKDNLVSVLLYKENYYAGMKQSTYSFDCINFDIHQYKFMNYADFFLADSEQELFKTINTIITKNKNNGMMYSDCWELTKEDFNTYKNNFVINDDMIEFYFDDCVICPSYTGTYAVPIPIVDILHLIKKYNPTPLIG